MECRYRIVGDTQISVCHLIESHSEAESKRNKAAKLSSRSFVVNYDNRPTRARELPRAPKKALQLGTVPPGTAVLGSVPEITETSHDDSTSSVSALNSLPDGGSPSCGHVRAASSSSGGRVTPKSSLQSLLATSPRARSSSARAAPASIPIPHAPISPTRRQVPAPTSDVAFHGGPKRILRAKSRQVCS